MGKPACSLRTKLIALVAVGLLSCGILPLTALADGDGTVAGPLAGPGYEGDARSASPDSDLSSVAEGAVLASSLAPNGTSIVSADVALDAAEPVVGSFTVDGLTYAVGPDGLTFVAADAPAVSDGTIAIPASVTYNGVAYPVTAVGPYAFYLSGATDVALPESIASIDDRAFRSSDVERVTVDAENPNLASFNGALYSADKTRLLLIPEGRKGSVLLSCETEVVEPSLFSHCSLVEAISVEEGGAAFSSWDGLLYSADGTTLLRVPAGATDITIRDGCTAIAAGALEGCAKLERINAPASVISISPDLFESVPMVSLPAQMAVQDETTSSVASSLHDQANESTDSPAEGEGEGLGSAAPQLTSMVALSSADDGHPTVDPAAIAVSLPAGANVAPWRAAGFGAANAQDSLEEVVEVANGDAPSEATASDELDLPVASLETASSYAGSNQVTVRCQDHAWVWRYGSGSGAPTTLLSKGASKSGTQQVLNWVEVETHDGGSTYTVSGHNQGIWGNVATSTLKSTYGWWIGTSKTAAPEFNTGADIIWPDGTREHMYRDSGKKGYAVQAGMIIELHKGIDVLVNFYGKDGGSSSLIGTASMVSGERITQSVEVPKRAGYAFGGYYTGLNGSGTKYYNADGTPAVTTFPASQTTTCSLYAYWIYPGTYKVTLNGNGGTVQGASSWFPPSSGPQVTQGAGNWNTMPGAVRAGYSFTGYYTAPSGGTQVYKPNGSGGAVCTNEGTYWKGSLWEYGDDATLYAQWSPLVTVDMNGGTATVVNCDAAGTQSKFTLDSSYAVIFAAGGTAWLNSGGAENNRITSVARSGYRMAGWSTSKACAPANAGSYSWYKASSGAVTLYAIWEPLVTIDMNGGTATLFGTANQTKVTHAPTGHYLDFKCPSSSNDHSGYNFATDYKRAGYTLAGWSTDKSCAPANALKLYTWTAAEPLTMYAIWSANAITLSWDYNGGQIDHSSGGTTRIIQYGPGKVLGDALEEVFWSSTSGRFTYEGHTFAGWWTAKTDGTQVTASTALPTANTTYYARWSTDAYAISYNLNGGAAVNPATYDVTTTTFTLKNPTRAGYRFVGWSGTGLSGSENTTVTIAKGSTGDRSYTANWIAQVTVDMQGGTADVRNCDAAGTQTKFALEASYAVNFGEGGGSWVDSGGDGSVRIGSVSRPGYRFCGWSTDKDCAAEDAGAYFWRSTSPATVYAIWEPLVTIDMNGGTATMFGTADQAQATHSYTGRYMQFNAPSISYTSWDHSGYNFLTVNKRDGYRFCGWSTDKGCAAANAGTYTWNGAAPVTLYAIWEPQVAVDMQGGVATVVNCDAAGMQSRFALEASYAVVFGKGGNAHVNSGGEGSVRISSVSRTGYRFCGWSTDKACAPGDAGGMNWYRSNGPATVYAIWEMESYAISYDLGGGAVSGAGNPTSYNVDTATFRLGNPTRAGYTFAGWSGTGLEGAANLLVEVAKGSTGNREYVANWRGNDIVLTWDVQLDGEDDVVTSQVYADGATVDLPEQPVRNGYALVGWWTEPDGGTKVTSNTPLPIEDATYYAHWVPIVAAAVPIEVTARVDLLGLEEQEAVLDDEGYQGYIESRSGEPLEVAEVSFEPLSGADELFGADASRVSLQALAEGSTSADYSFALDAPAALKAANGAAEAASLAPFALPDGYGTRKHVTYRFDIPDDVLASIDPARFSDVTTPVGQVVYTVALAS